MLGAGGITTGFCEELGIQRCTRWSGSSGSINGGCP